MERIWSSAQAVDELVAGLSKDGSPAAPPPCLQSVSAAREQLHSALQSLRSWNQEVEDGSRVASDTSVAESATTRSVVRSRVVSRAAYALPSAV